ncbi:MAG: GH3 auxin-responsive promoter family protein [Bacteroides sp.]|nr:GH3 auxin-responsive promoter family protein [Bacteroides sp.]MCM1413797.1 GH3 auxin-responsive promoter family protein [Bacteroides sp.]MCM1472184.1 GH3 auxin-responsive promoter family protein [Bacteroides sp.]
MNLTKTVRPIFLRRLRKSLEADADVEATQRAQLHELVTQARGTLWGRSHGYDRIGSYEDYVEAVAVTPYEELRPWVMKMIAGDRDILWPGLTRRFAQSSGTSDGKSKYIPITDSSLRLNHYRGGSDAVAHYLNNHADSRLFDGRSFILGGSFANELPAEVVGSAKVGDLSANLIDAINPLVNLVRIPSKRIALMTDWHRKLPALVDASIGRNVTNISGVPSWFLTVLRQILDRSGKSSLHQVWPNLEVFFHGGISFVPYREQYDAIIDPERMRYVETYNASEGFFAVQDLPEVSMGMKLLIDAGVFYEFIPIDKPESRPVPAWQVEQGKVYAMVITAANGLWRYPIGDTVRIESLSPLRISIAGRTKHYINAFGEEVMVHNTDAALARACHLLGCRVENYTAAPVYTTDRSKGHHQWLIEFSQRPADIEQFANTLDRMLTEENSDYQAKRSGDIFLSRLTIVEALPGLFDRWLESTGKLGGQRKVPRLSNDRRLMDRLLELNSNL